MAPFTIDDAVSILIESLPDYAAWHEELRGLIVSSLTFCLVVTALIRDRDSRYQSSKTV
jgi:hypothetical protein